MSLGSRIRELRIARGLTQAQLGEMVESDGNTISRWELDKLGMRREYVLKFAKALDTSVAFLLEETDDPARLSYSTGDMASDEIAISVAPSVSPKFNMAVRGSDLKGLKRLPIIRGVFPTHTEGRKMSGLTSRDVASWQIFPAEVYGIFDPQRPPFIIQVEDDSMMGAGIQNGALAVINPAEEVRDGEAALVCWRQRQAAIRLVYWRPDGGVELHPANPQYPKVYTFTKDEYLKENFSVKGKVMWTAQRPRRML